MGPLHHQTDADRAQIAALFPILQKLGLPKDFEFPLVKDPHYIPQPDILYAFITAILCFMVTFTAASMRFWVRSKGKFGMDDWLMVPAFGGYLAFSMVNLLGCTITGLGYHVYDLAIADIESALIIQFLHTVFWVFAMHFTRISVLHLLLRVTTHSPRPHRLYLRIILAVSYVFAALNFFLLVFECHPVNAAFTLAGRVTEGVCMGSTSIVMYSCLCWGHIFLDFCTMIPPLFVIARMKMSRGKKINLYVLVGLGLSSAICSAIRTMIYYDRLIRHFDITRDSIPVGFYGILEASIAVTVACLPALNHLLVSNFKQARRKLSGLMSSSNRTHTLSSNPYSSNASSNRKSRAHGRPSYGDRVAFNLKVFKGGRGGGSYSASATGGTDTMISGLYGIPRYHELDELNTSTVATRFEEEPGSAQRSWERLQDEELGIERVPRVPPAAAVNNVTVSKTITVTTRTVHEEQDELRIETSRSNHP